jgi:hypothetical protein
MLTKDYAKYTVAELQNTFTMVKLELKYCLIIGSKFQIKVNWEELFREVLNVDASQLSSDNVVQVYSFGYFKQLFENIEFGSDKS